MLPALIAAGAALAGGAMNRASVDAANRSNERLQREFAQSGIQWKVEDAKKAGIHPLAALGAQTHSFAPSQVGSTDMGTAVASSGQNIASAIDATRPAKQRASAIASTIDALTVERMSLENKLLQSQIFNSAIATLRSASPPMPSPDGSGVTIVPGQVESYAGFEAPLPGGSKWKIGPGTPAQTWEDQYGEVGGGVFGVENLLYDALRNMGQLPLRWPFEGFAQGVKKYVTGVRIPRAERPRGAVEYGPKNW